jgi:hypothetical protein
MRIARQDDWRIGTETKDPLSMVWKSNARTQVVQRYDRHILLLLVDPHGELVVGGGLFDLPELLDPAEDDGLL